MYQGVIYTQASKDLLSKFYISVIGNVNSLHKCPEMPEIVWPIPSSPGPWGSMGCPSIPPIHTCVSGMGKTVGQTCIYRWDRLEWIKFAISKSTICNEVKGSLASHCNSGLVYHVQSLSLLTGAYVLSVLRQNRVFFNPFTGRWLTTNSVKNGHIFKNFFPVKIYTNTNNSEANWAI